MTAELPPIFSRIPWVPPKYEGGIIYDIFGGRVRGYVHGDDGWSDCELNGRRPQIDDSEIFEWESLFEAVLGARKHFTMIELGCGFGRWLLLGAGALKRAHPGMPATFIGVEAEPTHYRWACEMAELNGLDMELIHAALGSDEGKVDFLILDDPAKQYGQSLIYPWTKDWLKDHDMSYSLSKVPTISLQTILSGLDHVDLINCDIQGAEADVFEAGAAELDRKVARVFIETHGDPLDRRLRALFSRLGWHCMHAYSPYQVQDTPFGPLDFDGGVLVYRNPRLFHANLVWQSKFVGFLRRSLGTLAWKKTLRRSDKSGQFI
jgi:FkbM family methyltransferase